MSRAPEMRVRPPQSPGPAIHRTYLAADIRRRRARERRAIRTMLIVSAIVGVILVAGIASLLIPGHGLAQAVARGTETEAYVHAREFVTASLRAPATAQFPWQPDSASFDGTAWRIAGYVDSQNGFGALIRSHWSCELEKSGGQWRCHALVIGSQRVR